MKRFIVIVLDSFGVGAMDDVDQVRPQDKGANTAYHIMQNSQTAIQWPNLIKLGLMNALGFDNGSYPKSKQAIFGKSKLKHFGADSFFGHQEIAGTNPVKPIFAPISDDIDAIEKALMDANYSVKRVQKDGLEILHVNGIVYVGDNMETDLGQAINVVGTLDCVSMEVIKDIGHTVRKVVKQPRVIAFGGSHVSKERLTESIITKENKYIGIDAPGSGVYDDNYHVEHIGYGVDETLQVPLALKAVGIQNNFYGKVANIVYNPNGKNFDAVDTDTIFSELYNDLKKNETGFYFTNIQETDLAGHAEDVNRYADRLNVSDRWLGEIIELMGDDDILLVMADHGNDPTIGHARHTRENVPLLIYNNKNETLVDVGVRDTMADVGQTVADFFAVKIPFGSSFLNKIYKKMNI